MQIRQNCRGSGGTGRQAGKEQSAKRRESAGTFFGGEMMAEGVKVAAGANHKRPKISRIACHLTASRLWGSALGRSRKGLAFTSPPQRHWARRPYKVPLTRRPERGGYDAKELRIMGEPENTTRAIETTHRIPWVSRRCPATTTTTTLP